MYSISVDSTDVYPYDIRPYQPHNDSSHTPVHPSYPVLVWTQFKTKKVSDHNK